MRRTIAVTPQLVKQLLGRAIRRAAVAGRHDAAHAVAAIGAGADAATQVVFTLALVEERVVPEGVGVPDINDSVGDRTALGVAPGRAATSLPRIFTIIHPGVSVCQRRIGHVQRPFNGARVPVSRCAAASIASWRRSRKCSSPRPAASSAAS
jgi:hypothetical protein